MKVFLSWSGDRSRQVAGELETWITSVIQSAEPWISTGLERGVRWLPEIMESLDSHSLAIICVTPGNQDAPWLLFEAGALSKHLGVEGRVIPYLLDFQSAGDLRDPLGQFNAALADQAGTWQLVQTLNGHAEHKQSPERLRRTFELWWPELEEKLEAIRTSRTAPATAPTRSDSEKLDDVLEAVRQLTREVPRMTDLLAHSAYDKYGRVVEPLRLPELYPGGFSGTGSLSVGGGKPASRSAETVVQIVRNALLMQGCNPEAMQVLDATTAGVNLLIHDHPSALSTRVLGVVRSDIQQMIGPVPVRFYRTSADGAVQLHEQEPDTPASLGTADSLNPKHSEDDEA